MRVVVALLCAVLVLTLSGQLVVKAIDTKVELVQIVFRHGDRTPVRSYPTDPYNVSTWEKYGGFGQLTQQGMERHMEFGQSLRNKYKQLDSLYNRVKHHVRSTDYDRTLMSAQSLLSGLFPPGNSYQRFNEKIAWQPIAIHTTESKQDKIFYSESCPRYDELRNEVEHSEEYLSLNAQYKDLFELIDKDAGFTDMSLDHLWMIGDVLVIEKSKGLKLPAWAEKNFERIKNSLGYGFFFENRLPEMAQLRAGTILDQMRTNIVAKTHNKKYAHELASIADNAEKSGEKEQRKYDKLELSLFSSHDTYVAAMTKLLNLTTHINQPPFASAVILELHRDVNSAKNNPNYYVQALLKNNTPSEPITYLPLPINGCAQLCPVEEFLMLTNEMIVRDPVKACLSKKIGSATNMTMGLTFSFAILVGILFIATAMVIMLRAKALIRRRGYQPQSDL